MTEKIEIAEIERLERENQKLQQRIRAYDNQILLQLRAIGLQHQNKAMQEIVDELDRRGR